jgi:hypothetical protein
VAAEIEISTVADASVLSGIGWLAPLPVHAAGNLDPEKELRPWQPLITAPFSRSRTDIWQIVPDFNNYPIWIDGCDGSRI